MLISIFLQLLLSNFKQIILLYYIIILLYYICNTLLFSTTAQNKVAKSIILDLIC